MCDKFEFQISFFFSLTKTHTTHQIRLKTLRLRRKRCKSLKEGSRRACYAVHQRIQVNFIIPLRGLFYKFNYGTFLSVLFLFSTLYSTSTLDKTTNRPEISLETFGRSVNDDSSFNIPRRTKSNGQRRVFMHRGEQTRQQCR